MDGEITIGTSLSTDKFDRQVAQLEKKIQKEENKKIVIGAKLESQKQELDNARQKTDALAEAYQKLKEVQDRLATGQATPKEFTTFQELQNTYGSLEKLGSEFDKALTKQNAIEQKVAQTEYTYDELVKMVQEYKQEIENIKMQKHVSEVDRLKESFNGVGSSIQNSITKVARLALGVFGVRSAYLALRRASSDLATYDKQYAANLEYIRYALTQAIAPVLRWIVQMAATLLGYINAILNGWFGINLFSRGSAENFNKMKKSTSGVSKAVKEIKKQLAGFDEINMLTDQSDTGTKAGAGGIATPSFDLSGLQGEKPAWLQWIIDNKSLITGALAGIAAGLVALKLGADGLLALGIGIAVAGLVALIQDIVDFIKDPSWEKFVNIVRDLGIVLTGVGIAMVAVNAANPIAWIMLLIGVIATVTAVVIQNWDKIKEVLGKVGKWIWDNIITPVGKFFSDLWTNVKTGVSNLWTGVKTILSKVGDWVKEHIINPVKTAFSNMWTNLKTGASNTWTKVKEVFSGVGKFFGGIWDTIKTKFKGIGQKVGDTFGGAFKTAVNGVLALIEHVLNSPINAINGLIDVINAVPGINLGRLSTFNLPRMAVGGIVNMPNRGTLVGGAIAGESGREGVLPLTDQQTMAELGREIGRHVLVNLTNITTMNGRVIGRELKQVQSEQEFAFNS